MKNLLINVGIVAAGALSGLGLAYLLNLIF